MQGKILKIKTGYNPNSSSIGVDMVIFFTAGAAITVLFNTMAAIICASGKEKVPAAAAEELAEPVGLLQQEDQA
jgi:hypothetical protein